MPNHHGNLCLRDECAESLILINQLTFISVVFAFSDRVCRQLVLKRLTLDVGWIRLLTPAERVPILKQSKESS